MVTGISIGPKSQLFIPYKLKIEKDSMTVKDSAVPMGTEGTYQEATDPENV